MAIKEQDKVFYEELANGDKVINLPVTRVNNVEGIGRSANTTYSVGDVVYTDNNLSVALKCTMAGTTSDSELDISSTSVGNTVVDGGVVWEIIARGGGGGGGGTLLTSYIDVTNFMKTTITSVAYSGEMYIFDLYTISSELSIPDIKFIEVCLCSISGVDGCAWFDCCLTDTEPTGESDYYSINKILRGSSGQNQQATSGVSVLLPPHVSGRYLVIINYFPKYDGYDLGEFYVRLHM